MGLIALVRRVTRDSSASSQKRRSDATKPRKQSTSDEKKLPAPEYLEYRETVSDTFFVALQAAGMSLLGGIAVEKARDPFGLTNTQDMSVSGGSDQNPGIDRD